MIDKEKRGDAPVQINNEVFFEEVARMLSDGFAVTLRVKGSSMFPFLRDGRDRVTLRKTDGVEVGDIVLARLDNGTHVLHRIYKKRGEDIALMGDGNLYATERCKKVQIAGKVMTIVRNGKAVSCRSLKERSLSGLWRGLLPVRRYLLYFLRRM